MPFKSEAQRAKFLQMLKDKKISQSTFDEYENASPKKLPERLHTPARAKVRLTKLTKVIK